MFWYDADRGGRRAGGREGRDLKGCAVYTVYRLSLASLPLA